MDGWGSRRSSGSCSSVRCTVGPIKSEHRPSSASLLMVKIVYPVQSTYLLDPGLGQDLDGVTRSGY